MPYAMVPPGYRAVFLGQAAFIDNLGAFSPLEAGVAEGSLFLARLDFAGLPPVEALNKLEMACLDAGVEMWPGYGHVVYAGTGEPSVYLAWQKGFAWIPIIIGILATVVLPPLLGSALWLILPQEVKSLITGLVNMGIMVLVMFIMMQVMKPLTAINSPGKSRSPKAPEETGS